MVFELTGFGDGFSLSLPVKPSGLLLLAIYIVGLSLYAFTTYRKPGERESLLSVLRLPVFLLLIVLAPFAAEFFIVRLTFTGAIATPGVPQGVEGPGFALLGAMPWLLAAGMFGAWPAMIVAFFGGLSRAGFESHSLLTVFHVVIEAALVAWLLRRKYVEWPGRVFRNPLFAGLIGGVVFGLLSGVELYVYTAGSFLEGLDFTLSLLQPTLFASMLEAGIAGALCLWLVRGGRVQWYRPEKLVTGPYNRSLAARLLSVFFVLGVISSGLLLFGDWLLVQSSARSLIEDQMERTADQAAGTVPFFVQTGRSVQGQVAATINTKLEDGSLTQEDIQALLRTYTYFHTLAIFDSQSERVYVYPPEGPIMESGQFELSAAIESALGGAPQEVILRPSADGQTAQMAYLTPITGPDSVEPIGVAVGVTDLGTNPYLLPVIEGFEQVTPGQAFLTDRDGNVLVHEDPYRILNVFDLSELPANEVTLEPAPDGTRRLVYVHPVAGYSWNVVVIVPQSEVQRLSTRIAVNLFAVQLCVGAVLLLSVYFISRRLTNPLRMMAGAAQSISLGNLSQPVEGGGEDEIGQLATSFEQMRLGLKARLEEMSLLLIAGQQVASTFHLDQALPPILEGIREVTRADLVRFVFVSEGQHEAYSAGEDPGNWGSLDLQIVSLTEEKRSLVLANPSRARAVLDIDSLRRPLEALAAVPLKNEDAYIGVLWEGYAQPHMFSQDELRLLSILSAQLGVAVSNARLYHQAERERSRLAAVLETTPDAVILIDTEGRIMLANPSAEIVLRSSAEEALGRDAADWFTSDGLLALLFEDTHEARSAEIQMEDGSVLFASVTDVPSGDVGGSGIVCVLWDITHYKKLDMLKSEFVSTVSHDLRAPLTLMRGYATMLTMVGAMNEQQKEFVSKILSSADQMGELIDNLLDLGRIEAGVGLHLEDVEVEDLIEDALEGYRPQAVNKQISIGVEVEHDMQPVEIDATLIRQAVANLVDNALKYTPAEGKITIAADQANGVQFIRVKDTGLGIAHTDQARLFEKFYRARRQESLSIKGSGLGLAIVKSIVEQHGGRVYVESKLGSGSTFTIEFPMRQEGVEGAQIGMSLDEDEN
jgi:two-component system phosphate regulon sensor histidine kinase PhoR